MPLACHWILRASVFSIMKWEENATSLLFWGLKHCEWERAMPDLRYCRTTLVKSFHWEISGWKYGIREFLSHFWLSHTWGFGNTSQVSGLNGRDTQACCVLHINYRYPACHPWAKSLLTESLPVLLKFAEKTENVYAISSTYSQPSVEGGRGHPLHNRGTWNIHKDSETSSSD